MVSANLESIEIMIRSIVFGVITTIGLTIASTLSDCPGYKASNVTRGASYLTADLGLAGTPCNIFSDDVADLKLTVEYQTGEFLRILTVCFKMPMPDVADETETRDYMSRFTTRPKMSIKSKNRFSRGRRVNRQPHQRQQSNFLWLKTHFHSP